MNNKIPLALTLCSTMIALPLQANEGHQWRAIAFGQSTDSNFSSNVLPEKLASTMSPSPEKTDAAGRRRPQPAHYHREPGR